MPVPRDKRYSTSFMVRITRQSGWVRMRSGLVTGLVPDPAQGSSILFDEHNYKRSVQQGGLSDSIENMLAFISIICGVVVFLYFYRLNISAMSEHGFDWLREKTIGWSHTPPVNKIDTHHHCVPPFYAKGEILIKAKQFNSP